MIPAESLSKHLCKWSPAQQWGEHGSTDWGCMVAMGSNLCCLDKKYKSTYPSKTTGFTVCCLLLGYYKDVSPSKAIWDVDMQSHKVITWVVATVLLNDPKISVLLMRFWLLQPSPLFLGWILHEAAWHEPPARTEVPSIHPNHSNTPHYPISPTDRSANPKAVTDCKHLLVLSMKPLNL